MSTCKDCKFSALEEMLVPAGFGSLAGIEVVMVCRANPPTLPNSLVSERISAQVLGGAAPATALGVHRATFPVVRDSMFCGRYEPRTS